MNDWAPRVTETMSKKELPSVVKSYDPPTQFWERFPVSRSDIHDLVIRHDGAVGVSVRLPPAQVRHPRTALYENKHIKKASNELMWKGALFLGPSFVFLDDVLDSESSTRDDDEWDFIAMVTPDRVARQLGYDQGLAYIQTPMFPVGEALMKECYRRFVFKPEEPRYCQDLPFRLAVLSLKVPPRFTQAWCTHWYDELTRMIEFVCDVADPMGVVSPHVIIARGRIRLEPDVAATHEIKPGSRGKNVMDSAQKGKERAVKKVVRNTQSTKRPQLVIRNRGRRQHHQIVKNVSLIFIGMLSTSAALKIYKYASHHVQTSRAVSPQQSFSGVSSQDKQMARSKHPVEQTSSKKRRHPWNHGGSGSRYSDVALPIVVGSPNSLVGQATWFDFKGNEAHVASTYARIQFPGLSPELKDYYKEIVEEYGHVASTEVLPDRNNPISSVSNLVPVAKDMSEVGEGCPSEATLELWRGSFVLPRMLKFNIGWIEEKLKERRGEEGNAAVSSAW
ncbi:hypothetical protein C5167_003352 [Papaver somniferum]|uniref:Uncharacterized protein n=1 Tax=Papaver somniferum TaxID=3469 RepID=A0A4Y7L0T3_PAPSO|nr:hypothetical protein C5167_003352 [Papaver somniferum]